MNLLENNISQILIDNYDVSVGHIDASQAIDVYKLNNGTIKTNNISINDIMHCSIMQEWKNDVIYLPNTFYRHTNKVYVCLYSPGNISVYPPSGKLNANMIMDDNYVWRYICDVKYNENDYVTFENANEYVRKGTIQSVNIITHSNHVMQSFASLYLHDTHMSGEGVQYVVENNQNNFIVSDILIQNGGLNYLPNDIMVITDKPMNNIDAAIIDVYIENGQVYIASFTNGQNYEYMDIIIIGDGENASVSFSSVAGVLTNVNVDNRGENYTWAKAIVLNSNRYIIGSTNIEPLNGYNSDLVRHIGPNKYIITSQFKLNTEINYYGIHRKLTDNNKFIFYDNLYIIDEFVPEENETVTVKLLLGN